MSEPSQIVKILEEVMSYHVKAKVSQYVNRHATNKTPSGNQMPLDATSSVLELEAISIGTRSMMLMGRASARKTGMRR